MAGLFLGAVVGFIVIYAYCLLRTSDYGDLCWFDAIVCTVILVASVWVGCTVDRESNLAYIARYQAAKATIEASLENEKLSDLTRIELLKQATEYNVALADKQHSAQRWYGFSIPDEVLDLEPINLERSEKQ